MLVYPSAIKVGPKSTFLHCQRPLVITDISRFVSNKIEYKVCVVIKFPSQKQIGVSIKIVLLFFHWSNNRKMDFEQFAKWLLKGSF